MTGGCGGARSAPAGIVRMTWRRARRLTGRSGTARYGGVSRPVKACEVGGRVEGTAGRVARFGPGFVAVTRAVAVAAVSAAGCGTAPG